MAIVTCVHRVKGEDPGGTLSLLNLAVCGVHPSMQCFYLVEGAAGTRAA